LIVAAQSVSQNRQTFDQFGRCTPAHGSAEHGATPRRAAKSSIAVLAEA
jgi:hypothetical protein